MATPVPKRVLASKFGIKEDTLRKRILREGWDNLKDKAVQVMGTVTVEVKPKPEKPQSVLLRERVAAQLERDMQAVEAAQGDGLAIAAKRQAVVSQIVQNAKPVHGWGEQANHTIISLGMLSGTEPPAIGCPDTIDLELPHRNPSIPKPPGESSEPQGLL